MNTNKIGKIFYKHTYNLLVLRRHIKIQLLHRTTENYFPMILDTFYYKVKINYMPYFKNGKKIHDKWKITFNVFLSFSSFDKFSLLFIQDH